jgi:uncharacterized protein (DUF4415 family)
MKKPINVIKKRGRPATGIRQLIGVRLDADVIGAIDNWRGKEMLGRPEAIRRLVEIGLKGKK